MSGKAIELHGQHWCLGCDEEMTGLISVSDEGGVIWWAISPVTGKAVMGGSATIDKAKAAVMRVRQERAA